MRGGGCLGKHNRNRLSRISSSGWVYRDMITVRPSVVGRWISIIWTVLNFSNTERVVNPGARSLGRRRNVTFSVQAIKARKMCASMRASFW